MALGQDVGMRPPGAQQQQAQQDSGGGNESQAGAFLFRQTGEGLDVAPGTGPEYERAPGAGGPDLQRDPGTEPELDIAPGAGRGSGAGSGASTGGGSELVINGNGGALTEVGKREELAQGGSYYQRYKTELIAGGVTAASLLALYLILRKKG